MGNDFDQVIIDFLAEEFKKDQGIDLLKDRLSTNFIASEKAKIASSYRHRLRSIYLLLQQINLDLNI